jgi:paxillin
MASVETDVLKPTARGVCAKCKQNVTGDMLICRGRTFHTDHFQCNGCQKSLGTEAFHFKDSESQYCEPCYLNCLTPTCISCEKPITGRHTYWNGAPYHIECFTCSRCDSKIDTERFTVVNSAPFCVKCEGSSALDTRESAKRKGTCTGCGLEGEDNFCEKCGEALDFQI